MVQFPAFVVVEGKAVIGSVLQIQSPNCSATGPLLVDGTELPVVIFQNEACAAARAVENQMIQFPTVVIVEGKPAIGSVSKIKSADTRTAGALRIDGAKFSIVILENEAGTTSWPIENEVVQFSTVVVIERKPAIGVGLEVVTTDATTSCSLLEHRRK